MARHHRLPYGSNTLALRPRGTAKIYENSLLRQARRGPDTSPKYTKTPCSGKLDEVLTPLHNIPATPDPNLLWCALTSPNPGTVIGYADLGSLELGGVYYV